MRNVELEVDGISLFSELFVKLFHDLKGLSVTSH